MHRIDWSKWALGIFVLLAIVIRWGTFYPSVINHDESTYFLIGKGLLEGQAYLVDSFDTKPIGIFLIYAAMSWLSAGSLFMVRLITAAIVGLTAYLLFRLGHRAGKDERVGWAAGMSYLLLCSIFKYYGLSPNTELFFVPFAVGAMLVIWGEERRLHHFAIAGLLLGLGFMVKYVIAADAFAIGAFLLWRGWRSGKLSRAIFQQCLPMTLVFFLPLLATYAYYSSIGQLDAFLFYTFDVTSRYPVESNWSSLVLYTLAFFGRFFPFTLLAIFAFLAPAQRDYEWQRFLLFWLSCVLVITLLPGKTFGHYQIQLMPPLALLAGSWFLRERQSQPWLRRLPTRWAWSALAVVLLSVSVGLFAYYTQRTDDPRIVAAELEQRLKPGELVYTGNYHHITYHLLNQPSLTPYVHSSLLFYPHHVDALEIDLVQEAHNVLSQDPRFVLLRTDHPHNELTAMIYDNYIITDTLLDKVWILEKIK